MNYLTGAVKSKTLWFNALFGVVLLANAFGFSEFQPDESLVVVGNLVLRFMTTKAITEK